MEPQRVAQIEDQAQQVSDQKKQRDTTTRLRAAQVTMDAQLVSARCFSSC